MNKHTPGPWKISRKGRIIYNIGPCTCDDYAGESWLVVPEADANLISAAPELLEALELAVSEYEKLPHSLGYDFTHLPAMRAAIAKAKGE